MVKKVLVLGGGSAGFLAAITLKQRLPHLQVDVLRSKDIGIIGVGEGTSFAVPRHLHGYMKIDQGEFYREVDPVWKLGIRYIWGPRPVFDYVFGPCFDTRYVALPKETGYYCQEDTSDSSLNGALMARNKAFARTREGWPHIEPHYAYHLENEKFVRYLEALAARRGISIADGTVVDVRQDGDGGVADVLLASGERLSADLYVDASGFRSLLLGKTFGEPFVSFKSSLFCDRAVVGGWDRGADEPIQPYTVAETMDAGWCWRIDHTHRINRGYVYSSSFISDEDAEREYRAKNPKVESARVIRFMTGHYARAWVKNVVAIGNSNGFVEPLESTAIAHICVMSQNLAEMLAESEFQPRPSLVGL
ncbi:MAG TPA: FAD-dependent oxidoreductase, partial [Gemmataceae bacterium]|nr:FAD-dependent oxidoreductase [Gemmataceae bacterium]